MKDSAAKVLNENSNNNLEYDSTREVLEKEYQVDTTDITSSESLTYVILDLTVNQMYERAAREARAYLKYKSNYPNYKERTEKLFDHINNLISAIKTKKNLAAVSNLTASKRKELGQATALHFQDLKQSLQRVTQIEYQMRLQDSRSTVWVINTFFICVFIVVMFALLREGFQSMQAPFEVFEHDVVGWIYKKFKI